MVNFLILGTQLWRKPFLPFRVTHWQQESSTMEVRTIPIKYNPYLFNWQQKQGKISMHLAPKATAYIIWHFISWSENTHSDKSRIPTDLFMFIFFSRTEFMHQMHSKKDNNTPWMWPPWTLQDFQTLWLNTWQYNGQHVLSKSFQNQQEIIL